MEEITLGTPTNRKTAIELNDHLGRGELSITQSKDAAMETGIDSGSDEARTLVTVISESISSLFRLQILINTPGPDRFRAALASYENPTIPSHLHLERRFWRSAAKRRHVMMEFGRAAESGEAVGSKAPPTRHRDSFSRLRSLTTSGRGPADKRAHDDKTSPPTIPRLTDFARPGVSFQCPICFTPQSFLSETSWR